MALKITKIAPFVSKFKKVLESNAPMCVVKEDAALSELVRAFVQLMARFVRGRARFVNIN
jgi:hypothetical protein